MTSHRAVRIGFPPGRAALLLFASVLLVGGVAAPACAQRGVLELNGRTLALSPPEMAALSVLRGTLSGRQRGQQDNALERARRVAQSPDARYVLALYQLEIAQQRSDDVLRAEALDVLIAAGDNPPDKLAGYLSVRGGIAYRAGDVATAKTLWTRVLAMKPDDPAALSNMALILQKENDPKGAAELLERVINGNLAAGRPVSESLYRQWMSAAHQARLTPAGIDAAHALVRAYPTPGNWRDALVVYRQLAQPVDRMEIDLLRLMRVARALTKAPEYQRMSQLLIQAGFGAEARQVVDEGSARGVLDPFDDMTLAITAEADRAIGKEKARIAQPRRPGATGLDLPDSLTGMGRHAEAIPLYRAAIARAGPDATEAKLHLAMALRLSGQHAEAAALFRELASRPGPYRDIAIFWSDWLAQQPGG